MTLSIAAGCFRLLCFCPVFGTKADLRFSLSSDIDKQIAIKTLADLRIGNCMRTKQLPARPIP